MTTFPLPRGSRRNRRYALGALAALVFLAGYVVVLTNEERTMARFYEDLRATDADLYLSKIRQARGFRAFVKEFAAIHDYSRPMQDAPAFVIGLWALFDQEKRVGDGFIPEACLSGIVIEDGQVKMFGGKTVRYPARYTMQGNTITAHLQGAPDAAIAAVGYGSHLHHIEVKLPGDERTLYGYRCH